MMMTVVEFISGAGVANQWPVISGQWTVGGGQWAVGSSQDATSF